MSRPLSDSPIDEVLTLVDRLSAPHQSSFTIEIDDDIRRVTVDHEPLLKQLRDAVISSVGARPGGGGLASERNVIDSDALEQYEAYEKTIIGLYKEVTDAVPFETPEKTLRQWYIEFANRARSGKVSMDVVHKKAKKLSSIVSAIENKLNPPSVMEITSPCPRCGVAYGMDEQGVYRHAIIVESRIDENKSLDDTRARCVACKATWVHGRGMRQLRWEIDQAEAGRHADEIVEQIFDKYDTIESAGVQTRPFSDRGSA